MSSPASSRNTAAPVVESPAISARCTGAAPRQRGSSEKCRLIQPEAGRGEQRLADQAAVGDDDAEVGAIREQRRGRVVVEAGRVQHRQAELERAGLHRRGREHAAAPLRRGRARHHADDLVRPAASASSEGTAATGVPAKSSRMSSLPIGAVQPRRRGIATRSTSQDEIASQDERRLSSC